MKGKCEEIEVGLNILVDFWWLFWFLTGFSSIFASTLLLMYLFGESLARSLSSVFLPSSSSQPFPVLPTPPNLKG